MSQNLYKIEQNHVKLLQIKDFYFDLDDKDFIKYFISRTGICIDQVEKFEELKDMLLNPDQNEKMHHTIIRARLQDCWEVYQMSFI